MTLPKPPSGRRLTMNASLAAVLFAPHLAFGQGTPYSIDTEFMRPTFGADSFSGVDVPTTTKPMTVRVGGMMMYTRDPVTLWDRLANDERGAPIGSIVNDRFSFMGGVSLDLSERLTLHGMIPLALNTGADDGEASDYAAPGFGLQDVGVGARLIALRSRDQKFNLGVRAGLIFPSGRAEAYLGDAGFRAHGGLLASLRVGRTLFAVDSGVMFRPETIETFEDFDLGTELLTSFAVRHKLPDATRLGVTGQVLTKAGFTKFLQGGGENAAEALVGVQAYPSRMTTIDVSVGRGLTQGYSTTGLRILAGVTVELAPKEEVPLPPVPPPPPVRPPDPPIIVEDPPPERVETELIVVTEEQIEVKQRLEFVVNTTTLQDKSRPTLKGVADFINSEWRIAHLEIVGHASAEGSYEYNYNLSQGRARTIWQELIQLGVHPDRISYKGMGEVVPRDLSKSTVELSEEDLQDNRRVEFNIIKKYDPLEENPFEGFESTIKAPWNGEILRVVVPEKPAEPEPEPEVDEFETGPFDLDELEGGLELDDSDDGGL